MIERLRVRIPAGAAGEFYFSRVKFVCWLLFGVRSTPVLPQLHVKKQTTEDQKKKKKNWSFCQKCRRQITGKHVYTLDPTKSEWVDYVVVHAYWWNLSGNELTLSLSGNIQPQSSQLAEPLWTDPGIKSGTSVCEPISTSKNNNNNKNKAQTRNKWSNILGKSSQARKKRPTPSMLVCCFKGWLFVW